MKIIISILFFVLVGITFGILVGVGRSIFDNIKYKFNNSTFLVYYKSNKNDFPVELEKNECGYFIAALSQKYTQNEIDKLVNDGVLIRSILNFNQAKKFSSFTLDIITLCGKKSVRVLVVVDSNENTTAPIFIDVKDFNKAVKIVMKI